MDASGERSLRRWIGASVVVPAPPEMVYANVLKVENFPAWAAGVRNVEVLRQSDPPHSPGMVSEWEVSLLSVRRRVVSVLDESEAPNHLRWSYISMIHGWGECWISTSAGATLVEFATEFHVREPHLDRLLHSSFSEGVVRHYLRRSLLKLGEISLPEGADRRGIRVGSLLSLDRGE
jgi:ribosome-associated toxin RatA of RatAB toxin-antitoxin module